MSRVWTAAFAVLGLLLVAGCGRAEPAVLPTDRVQLVAAYTVRGGFAPPSWLAIEAPTVLVYSDGRVVAGVTRVLTLTREDVAALVGDLRDDLDGFGATVDSPDAHTIMDAPGTVLAVWRGGDRLQTVSAYALDLVDDYPRALKRAYQRLADLAKRADGAGTPYTSDQVRLVLEPVTETGQESVRPWPAQITVPPAGSVGLRSADLGGAAAAAVTASLPAGTWRSGPWPLYRTPDGTVYRVAWRYLAPGEDLLR